MGSPRSVIPAMIASRSEPDVSVHRQGRVRPPFRAVLLLVASITVGACAAAPGGPTPIPIPSPTCGGLEVLVEGALPCSRVVEIAVGTLAASYPDHVARGISAIEVTLASCQDGAVPPQVDCAGNAFAQHVLVTFGPAGAGGPIEPSLIVVVAPVDGHVLGIENPLIR